MQNWRIGLRLLGALLLAAGILALLDDLHITGAGLDYRPAALGALWHGWHAPSLNLVQAIVERYVWPHLWNYVLLPVLLLPGWMVAAICGVALIGFSYLRIFAHNAASPVR